MKLPFLPFLRKKSPSSYFLVLVLRNEKVNAVVFEELEGKIRVIGQHIQVFQKSIEEADVEEMLQVSDRAISKAEESLPENIETHKTIFGVKETWVENDRIKKEYLVKLKKVSEELELTPIGFLVITQAISRLLQKEEGAPVSAIIVEVGSKFITVSLIRAGRTIETKTSEIHESVPYTVDTLLKHFESLEILPAKIILFDGEKDLSQEFLNHSWSKSLPFLHLPQIASLPANFDAKAVLVGAATQMGFDILQEPIRTKEDKNTEGTGKTEEDLESQEKDKNTVQSETYLTPEDLGFIADTVETRKEIIPDKKEEEVIETVQDMPETRHRTGQQLLKQLLLRLLPKNLPPKAHFPKVIKKNFIIPTTFLLTLMLLSFLYLFVLQTEITLTIKPKVIEKEKTVVFSTSPITDPNIINIIGEAVEVAQQDSISTAATGKKEIGSNASGKVTIFNNHINEINLSSGTKITSENGLIFTLDDRILVASASSDPFEGIKPSKKEASITAVSIGHEYNLPSTTKFSINDDPLLAAKNANPFSGGTKQKVTVVSAADIDKLKEELPKTLESKAMEDIKKKIPKDSVLLPFFANKSLDNEKTDKKLEQEADTVTLTATVVYKGISYKKADIASLGKSLVKESIPRNLILLEDNLKIEIKDLKQKDQTITANVKVKALLQPKIQEDDLIDQVSGKSFAEAEERLLKISQASKVLIYSKPNIPLFPKIVSRNHKNVKITIKLDE